MPRLPQNIINNVFYLYWSREDALAGKNPGGTGFIVRYDGTFDGELSGHHFYGVTNWHVACRGYSTIRLNTKDGGTDIIELDPAEWHFLPGRYDVAAVPMLFDHKLHEVSTVSTLQFTRRPAPSGGTFIGRPPPDIGVGDDVFMIGLFVDHGGITTNVPSARFGNVSMLPNPNATIKQPTGYLGESYVVDMHSRTGFSGSPVYVYRTFGSDLADLHGIRFEELHIDQFKSRPLSGGYDPLSQRLTGYIRPRQLFQLLGIHWGQFPEKWELRDKSSLPESRRDMIVEGGYVEGMSGMTCVIPAWSIIEVLQMPELKRLRLPEIARAEEQQRELMAKHRANFPKAEPATPTATTAVPPASPSSDA